MFMVQMMLCSERHKAIAYVMAFFYKKPVGQGDVVGL